MSNAYTFTIVQGTTVDFRIEYKDSVGQPIDLSEYQSKMHIRSSYNSNTAIAQLSSSLKLDGTGLNMTPTSGSKILPKSSGSINIYISAASSSMFNFKDAYYDLQIISGSGINQYIKRILYGKIRLINSVTRN